MVDLDPYTLRLRLCDDSGMVSYEPSDSIMKLVVVPGETYLDRLNNLREMTWPKRAHDPVTEPFACTGSTHLAGEHIKCTSPAHRAKDDDWLKVNVRGEWAEVLVRDILVALCRKQGLSLTSDVEPETPARNYELATRLGIGYVFGIPDEGTKA
jgi:hypothetical protein